MKSLRFFLILIFQLFYISSSLAYTHHIQNTDNQEYNLEVPFIGIGSPTKVNNIKPGEKREFSTPLLNCVKGDIKLLNKEGKEVTKLSISGLLGKCGSLDLYIWKIDNNAFIGFKNDYDAAMATKKAKEEAKQKAELEKKKDEEDRKALNEAIEQGKIDEVKKGIAKGINLNAKDTNGKMPLNIAARAGNADVLRLLLQAKADPNAQDNNGNTPLIESIDANKLNIAQELLKPEYKVDINKKNNSQNTALHVAAQKNNFRGVRLLIEHKADPNLLNFSREWDRRETGGCSFGDCWGSDVYKIIQKTAMDMATDPRIIDYLKPITTAKSSVREEGVNAYW